MSPQDSNKAMDFGRHIVLFFSVEMFCFSRYIILGNI